MWKTLTINENQIKTVTEKSALIKMPHNSIYDGFVFWHPVKLLRTAFGSPTIAYTDDFVFRLKKYGKGRFNSRDIIDEEEIDAEEIESVFSNIQVAPLIHTPEKLEPEKTEALEELRDEQNKNI